MTDHVIHHDPAVVALVERGVRRALTEAADAIEAKCRETEALRDAMQTPSARAMFDQQAWAQEDAARIVRSRIPPP